jgi:hypothetical protein
MGFTLHMLWIVLVLPSFPDILAKLFRDDDSGNGYLTFVCFDLTV